jgi:hypothetical protein
MIKVAREFKETGRIAPYETEYLGRDGSRCWGLFGAAKIGGKADGIAFIVDITERKKLEEEIRSMANHDSTACRTGDFSWSFQPRVCGGAPQSEK